MPVERVPVSIPVESRAPGGRTNAYLVGGAAPLLVDPAAETERLNEAADRLGVAHVAVTHAHADHVGAVARYADRFDASVWARAGREARFRRATGVRPDRTFRSGTVVGPATVLETPGHAPDHVAFVAGDGALVGDLAVADGSVFVGGDDGDVRAYLTSLRRLARRDAAVLWPGHGPPIEDPRSTLERLLRHRLDREARVREAVRDGARTPSAIVDAAYERDLGGHRDLARRAVEAHLRKLAVEGSVTWDGETAAVGPAAADGG